MKTEFKIFIRTLTSYLMTFTGSLIVLWFVFVVVTSILGLRYYSGYSMELMIFLFIMGIVVIGIASVINISLSIDLIAEAKMKELKFTYKYEEFAKNMIKYGLGVIGVLVIAVLMGDYFIHKRKLEEFKSTTSEIVEAHEANLENVFSYLEDTSQILKIMDVLSTVNRSSDDVSSVELIFFVNVLGKENFIRYWDGMKSDYLISHELENQVIILSEEEKELVLGLLEGKKTGAHVLELDGGSISGYYPVTKNGKKMVVRVNPPFVSSGGRRL